MKDQRSGRKKRMNLADAVKVKFRLCLIEAMYCSYSYSQGIQACDRDELFSLLRLCKQGRHLIDYDVVLLAAHMSKLRLYSNSVAGCVFNHTLCVINILGKALL